MIARREHLTIEGLQAIVNLRASMNWGLTEELIAALPTTIPVKRPEIVLHVIPATLNLESSIKNNNLHPEWVAGFYTGESNFFIALQKSKTKSGLSTSLRFSIAQHSRDLLLLESFVNLFASDFVMNYKKR